MGNPASVPVALGYLVYKLLVVRVASKMVSSFFKKLVTAAVLLGSQVSVFAAPTAVDSLSYEARDLVARATPAAPHFVVYSDEWVNGENGPPATSQINGFNVL